MKLEKETIKNSKAAFSANLKRLLLKDFIYCLSLAVLGSLSYLLTRQFFLPGEVQRKTHLILYLLPIRVALSHHKEVGEVEEAMRMSSQLVVLKH